MIMIKKWRRNYLPHVVLILTFSLIILLSIVSYSFNIFSFFSHNRMLNSIFFIFVILFTSLLIIIIITNNNKNKRDIILIPYKVMYMDHDRLLIEHNKRILTIRENNILKKRRILLLNIVVVQNMEIIQIKPIPGKYNVKKIIYL